MTKREVTKRLRELRKLVKSTHWIKESYACERDGKTCYCLGGMINYLAEVPLATNTDQYEEMKKAFRDNGDEPRYDEAIVLRERIQDAIEKFDPLWSQGTFGMTTRGRPHIESWNDHEERTRDDVVTVLSMAIGDKR